MEIPFDVIIKSGIQRGSILHSDMFEWIDHGKFFVVIGISEEYIAGYFFINSNIHKSIYGKQEQLDMQFVMKHADYDFLRYDSFLSAVKINEVSCKKIAQSIKEGTTTVVGLMKPEDMNLILEKARGSKLFSKRIKERYFYED